MVQKGNGADKGLLRQEELRRYARLSPKERLEALASSADAKRLVQAVPAHALYRDIVEVGLADSTDIVRLASPRQFRIFVDLGGWKKDRIDFRKVVRWLRAGRGSDTEEFLAKVRGLDTELLGFVLKAGTALHNLEENPDARYRGATMEAPDGKHVIEFPVEGLELSAMRALVIDLISEDPFRAITMLEAVRWELPSQFEETCRQFRMARLEDLGFPPLERAVSLFSYIDPDKEKPPLQGELPPRSALEPVRPIDYWTVAASGLSEGEQEALEEELRYLVNSALVAEGAEPGDPAAIREVTQMVRNTLSLALEFLTSADPRRGSEILRERRADQLFHVGFSLGLRLKFRADRIARRPLAVLDGEYLLFPEERATIEALRRKRPGRPATGETGKPESFRWLREISEADASLARAEQQVTLFSAVLGGDPSAAEASLARFGAPLAQIGIESLFRALLANAILDERIQLTPVPADRLPELWERLFELDGQTVRLRARAKERASSALRAAVPESAHAELERGIGRSLDAFLVEWGEPFRTGTLSEREVGILLPLGRPGRL